MAALEAMARLLQWYHEWSAAVHHCTSSAGAERSCTSRPCLPVAVRHADSLH